MGEIFGSAVQIHPGPPLKHGCLAFQAAVSFYKCAFLCIFGCNRVLFPSYPIRYCAILH